MNTSILQDKTTYEDLKNHTNIFFETNKDSNEHIYVWHALKAYMRGPQGLKYVFPRNSGARNPIVIKEQGTCKESARTLLYFK